MKKCLIVDDELICGEILAHMLRNHFECKTVTSGEEAWEVIESNWRKGEHFDLICCDLEMPEMSGHGLIRKFRALEKTGPEPAASPTKIFVVSAGTSPWGTGETLLDDAADGYITKPCNPKELLELLLQNGLVESDEI